MELIIVRYLHNEMSATWFFAIFDCLACALDFMEHVQSSGGKAVLDTLGELPSWGDFYEEE